MGEYEVSTINNNKYNKPDWIIDLSKMGKKRERREMLNRDKSSSGKEAPVTEPDNVGEDVGGDARGG